MTLANSYCHRIASAVLNIHRPVDVHDRAVTSGPRSAVVTEREVAQDVTLHEEHAEVLRKAVSDPTFVGEIDWADGTIEIIETAEHALVNKTARVVEEVGLKKIGSDHVETIRDKLRRQQVEIERLGADGKVIRDPRTA